MMESVVEGQRASPPHEDFWMCLSTFTAFLSDGSDASKAPEGVEIAQSNGVVRKAEHRGEHEGADPWKRGEDGGVGVWRLGCTLKFLEPALEVLIGVTAMLTYEEQLLEKQIEVSRGGFGGSRSDAEWRFVEDFENVVGLNASDTMFTNKFANVYQAKVCWIVIEEKLQELAEKRVEGLVSRSE